MPVYRYTAVDPRGQQVSDTIESNTEAEAKAAIKEAGYYLTNIAEVQEQQAAAPRKGFSLSFGGQRVSAKVLTTFTRQLATLIDAGLPLLKGLSTLQKQEKNVPLKNAIQAMSASVEGGSTFSEAMAQHPTIFNKLYVNMVRAGEVGGVLEVVLLRLAEFQEKALRIRNKVLAAMIYPMVVLAIAFLLLGFLLYFVVPKFQEIFDEMLSGKPLPALTRWVIDASKILQDYWIGLLAGLIVLVVAFKLFANSAYGSALLDKIKLKLPVFGNLLRLTAISRFARTLGTLVTSGVPILQALTITRETAGNFVLEEAITKVHDAVKEGEPIVVPLESSGVFPPMVISMIEVGEETGRLPDMLIRVADVYEEEVDTAVAGLTSILEPIMIVLLAMIVGTIVVALFLPLVDIIQTMSGGGGAQ